ncbi:MAG: hypothetical protein IM507_13420 [Microcystis sp. M20BS1]|uniref:hypothetical protein n=1 Tax=unclassified Microcystis TaxID=2643300 RepID=UPI002579874C|nr:MULTISPECIES: hypothetical protein [unclassified Microcystis]MCA2624819.1 hypothetical protein [Microcystis sp. M19BS1]MCA2633345.1 hypothetical protein [Microcystis sp. M20BS1]
MSPPITLVIPDSGQTSLIITDTPSDLIAVGGGNLSEAASAIGIRDKIGSLQGEQRLSALVLKDVPPGFPGPPGPPLLIKGNLNSIGDLPTNPSIGHGYLIQGILYTWSGIAWINGGQLQGPIGLSAYQVALDNGFIGTEQEWLDSLKPQWSVIHW